MGNIYGFPVRQKRFIMALYGENYLLIAEIWDFDVKYMKYSGRNEKNICV